MTLWNCPGKNDWTRNRLHEVILQVHDDIACQLPVKTSKQNDGLDGRKYVNKLGANRNVTSTMLSKCNVYKIQNITSKTVWTLILRQLTDKNDLHLYTQFVKNANTVLHWQGPPPKRPNQMVAQIGSTSLSGLQMDMNIITKNCQAVVSTWCVLS